MFPLGLLLVNIFSSIDLNSLLINRLVFLLINSKRNTDDTVM